MSILVFVHNHIKNCYCSKISNITYYSHLATVDLFVINDSHLCCHFTYLNDADGCCHITYLNDADGEYISKKIMTQTCNYKLHYQKSHQAFSEV